MEQGTAEWHQIRLGKVTASRVADVMAKTKSGPSASRTNYMAQLLCERLTGNPTECFTNAAMAHGTATEPEARLAYSFHHDADVTEIAFVDHPTILMSGASPDGLIGDDGLLEIKAPNTSTHLDTLLSGTIPGKYQSQMTWQLACCQRDWCDFVSYDPRLPEHLRLFVKRFHRDDLRVAEMEEEVRTFLQELDEKIAALSALNGERLAA
jgi:putative phage-type endonuclease